eukprot:2142338-Rhodomonas_salina.1
MLVGPGAVNARQLSSAVHRSAGFTRCPPDPLNPAVYKPVRCLSPRSPEFRASRLCTVRALEGVECALARAVQPQW